MQVSRTALVTQLRALGVMQGQVLLVHSSFRALRPVEGGPHGVLEGLCEALGASREASPADVAARDNRRPSASEAGSGADGFGLVGRPARAEFMIG